MESIIVVSDIEKISSLRVRESTKRELKSFSRNGETREETLLRLFKTIRLLESNFGTKVIKEGNIIGTKYERLDKTIKLKTDINQYTIVCTFNDLSKFTIASGRNNIEKDSFKEWEIDLEIVNILIQNGKEIGKRKMMKWQEPSFLLEENPKEYLLLYLVAVKQVLESMLRVNIFEINKTDDFFNLNKWKEAYKRENLSMESFYRDIEKKLR